MPGGQDVDRPRCADFGRIDPHQVEKKIVVDHDGERVVLAPADTVCATRSWSALAQLAAAGQMACRSTAWADVVTEKFTAARLSGCCYVAQRFVQVYLALAEQLADSDYLGSDDTSARVLEVLS
jgi:hypothetical protein